MLFIPSASEAREEIHLAPRPDDWTKPWEQQRMRVLDVRVEQQQYVLYHAELSEHAAAATAAAREDPDGLAPPLPPSGPPCDAEIPRKIHMEVPDPEADVRFQYQELKWNPPLPEGTFEQPAPPGDARSNKSIASEGQRLGYRAGRIRDDRRHAALDEVDRLVRVVDGPHADTQAASKAAYQGVRVRLGALQVEPTAEGGPGRALNRVGPKWLARPHEQRARDSKARGPPRDRGAPD